MQKRKKICNEKLYNLKKENGKYYKNVKQMLKIEKEYIKCNKIGENGKTREKLTKIEIKSKHRKNFKILSNFIKIIQKKRLEEKYKLSSYFKKYANK